MKNLITYLKTLWSRVADSQSTDVSLDRWLTVGSPSGLDAKWKQNPFMRFAVVLTLIFTIGSGNVWGALTEEYSYTFTAKQFANNTTAKTLGSITWTPATSWKSGSGYWGYDATKGQQWGSSSNTLNTLTLTAGSSISNIKKITINASTASSGYCKLSVKVGSTAIGSEQTLTATATNYNFESATGLSGAVQIKMVNNSKAKAQYIKSITIYTEDAVTPTLTVSGDATNLAMGDAKVNGSGVTNNTLTFSGANLTANATLSITGTNAGMFSVSPTNVSKGSGTITNQTITVTYTPTSAGSHSATLTIASSGATSKTIALSGTGKYEVIWQNNGGDYETTLVASGQRPTFPDAPSSCDDGEGASTTFYGWSIGTWSGKTNDLAGKTIYTSAASMPTVTGNGTTYHAVFCKGGALTYATSIAANDVVYLATSTESGASGVTGANANGKDADVSTNQADWMPFTVQTNSTGWKLQNGTNYIQATAKNFAFTTSTPNVLTFAQEGSTGKYRMIFTSSGTNYALGDNSGSYWRFYSTANSYTWYYVLKASAGTNYMTTCAVTHTVSAVVDPAEKATVTLGATTVAEGGTTTATHSAITTGYEFVNWSISGTGATLSSTTSNPTTITMGTANVTVTANLRCITPTFSAHPSNVTCSQNASTTLSVTAAAGGASLSYQWMQCATSGGTYVNVTGGSGGTTRTYTPPTTSLGTMYYKCKVTNAANGCSANATSNAASVTVKGTVTYDANGGTGTMTDASSPYTSGAAVTVKSNTFTAPEGKQFDHWNTAANNSGATYAAGATFSMSGNTTLYAQWACITPSISVQPAGASYTKDDTPTDLSVTASGGTLSYQWKQCATIDGVYSNVASGGTSRTYTPSTASVGTIYYKCVVTNTGSSCNTTVTSDAAAITVNAASYFTNGATVFIQTGSVSSAWDDNSCVKAWFNASGAGGAAQTTYWLYDGTGDNNGKKLFATIVPASGDLNQVTLQRFASNCSDFWNNNGTLTKASDGGSNTFRTEGPGTSAVTWNASGVVLNLHGDPSGDAWASSLATFSDQGNGVWVATYNNYAPANAAGESQDFKIKTSYNDWIGNTGNNDNATLSGMHVGSTYNITATLDVKDHSLEMSKTFVKGTVHFDLQGHGLAISDLTNVTAGSKISAPGTPSATGYDFGGWYKEPACTNEWTFATDEVEETMTLYAKWTANVYTITKTLTNVSNTGLPASFTYTGTTTTALNSTFTVDATNFFLPSSIAVTMGGTPLTAGTHYTYNNSTGAFTFSAVITGNIVITATATAKLKSIAITTQPTTRKYFAGESFSSTGAVVTATMGDGSTKAVTASATWTPPATPLAAGTSLTVTASYTENGINQTATTTIDVYSVTVNKKNEDGDAVSADGVTATWTVGTKALAASASGASKYVFKQWEVTGASIGSTSSANTTLSSPTANVVVNAVFWKPRTVKWSVNGNDSYATGGPTTTVAYNGTISTVPTNPSGLACAGTFIAWTDAAHNNGTTAKASTSYYESKLFTAANQFPNITAATTTFYAVFAEKTNSDGYKYIGDDGTLTDGKKYIFVNAKSAGSAYALKATDLAAPNSGNNGTAVSVTVTSNAEGVLVTTINTALEFEYVSSGTKLKYEVDGPATRYLFINGDGVGMKSDDSRSRYTTDAGLQGWNNKVTTYYDVYYNSTSGKFEKMASAGSRVYAFIKQTATYGNYVTECDANIVSVTYDANGGATSCANTTTDKTEDFTVCSSAPTRDYYTFAGWLCSADDEVYAANATIDADAIDADFTLTAQWTPVPYSITYNYNGGSAQVDPVPATSYTVESSDITLQTPTKGHDRFDGWYENADLSTGGVKTTIAAGSHENKTYYAKWTARHEIIFDADGATTTIYRADDENMEDAVAGQGSVPSDPDAPTACSSKVFVGWSESTIDGETDDEPGDLMKPAAGTVDEDKHYYAVWANESSESGTVKLIDDAFNVTGTDAVTSRSGWTSLSTIYGGSGSIRFSSGSNPGSMKLVKTGMGFGTNVTSATITFKIKKYSGSETSGTLTIGSDWVNDNTTKFSKDGGVNKASSVTYTTSDASNWTSCTCNVYDINSNTEIILDGTTNQRIHVKDFLMTYTGTIYSYSAYSTSCCATKVTLSDPSITGTGATITFDKSSPVWTCGGAKTVTATLTLTAGYQASALSFAVNSGTVSISPAISTPVTSSQVYTLTFAEDQNATLTTTATIAAKPLNGITITPSSGEVYVGQYVDFTVSYDPADYLSPGYTLNATPVYVTKESAAPANTKLRLKGGRGSGPGASITETVNETVTIKASGDNTKTASVNMTVNPLPRVHFVDLVHGKAFADVEATIVENALNPNKTTKTSVDWVTPNANTCEENHLHLVGWIREDWPALVAYLNGTGDAPTTTAIVGAGNDGAGHAYYIAAGASINVQTFDGVTFYAVWSKVE